MSGNELEIERRFLIRLPERAFLEREAEATEITQTYLLSPEKGRTERVRRRGLEGVFTYTHTVKTRISDMTRREIEREISPEEYAALLLTADPKRRVIEKTRWCLPYGGRVFEIDVFPFWRGMAILEIELEREDARFELPPGIEPIREVTGDKRYTNASLALTVPDEE